MSQLGSCAFPAAETASERRLVVELFVFQREGGRRLRLKNVGVLRRMYKRTVIRIFVASVPDAILDLSSIVKLKVTVTTLKQFDDGSKVGILDVKSGLVALEQVQLELPAARKFVDVTLVPVYQSTSAHARPEFVIKVFWNSHVLFEFVTSVFHKSAPSRRHSSHSDEPCKVVKALSEVTGEWSEYFAPISAPAEVLIPPAPSIQCALKQNGL